MTCCGHGTAGPVPHGCCECGPTFCLPHTFSRHFVSAREKREHLERYKEQLQQEIEGVDERLQELRSEGK